MNPTDFPGSAPAGPAHVIDVTEATFGAEVVERSRQVPVVLDLWASWCGPCRQLSPVLEKLAAEGNGAWVLAKLDVDANPRIAQALKVQGIPAVKAVVDGQIVDEFVGAMPEQQVRQWLDRLGANGAGAPDAAPDEPPPDDRLVAAFGAERDGDLDVAEQAYREVLADAPADPAATAGVARIALYRRADTADEAALAARVAADPGDVAAVLALADLDVLRGNPHLAFERLIGLIRRTDGAERDGARERLLGLFATLAPDNPAVLSARRELANALF